MCVGDVGVFEVGLALFAQLAYIAICVNALVVQNFLLHFLYHFLAVLFSPQHHFAQF